MDNKDSTDSYSMADAPTVSINGIPTDEWANAIATRIQDEMTFGEDNVIIASAVEQFLTDYPHYTEQFVGTSIIEEEYFEKL